jgi:hypothetical protein
VIEYILDVRDKLKLTQAVLDQMPDGHDMDIDTAMKTWWYNIRATGGLRLTELGYFTFKRVVDLESYNMSIDWDTFDRQTILKLDRRLQMPYYIEVKKKIPVNVVFFGSREAMLAQLYGNLNTFLDNYKS